MNVLVSVYKLISDSTQLDKYVAEIVLPYHGQAKVISAFGYSKEEAIINLKNHIYEYKQIEFHSINISDVLNLNLAKDIIDS